MQLWHLSYPHLRFNWKARHFPIRKYNRIHSFQAWCMLSLLRFRDSRIEMRYSIVLTISLDSFMDWLNFHEKDRFHDDGTFPSDQIIWIVNLILTGIGCIIVWITGYQSTAMQWTTQNELNFGNPIFNGISFWLLAFGIWFEVVGEIAIQVKSSGVIPAWGEGKSLECELDSCRHIAVPSLSSIACAFLCDCIAVRIQRWQNMNACVVQ